MGRAPHLLIVTRLLTRFGLDSPELRAWAWYDVANSAFWCTVIVAVFPPFFSAYANEGVDRGVATERFAWTTTLAVTLVALLAPVLGALADQRAMKKRLLAVSTTLGVVAAAGMAFIGRGEWQFAAALFLVGNVGAASCLIFYDALLPHVARPDQLDRASGAAYSLGYLFSGLLLLVNLAWIVSPATFGLPDTTMGIRLSFVSVAIWWALFSLPLFRRVPEPAAVPLEGGHGVVGAAFRGAWKTFQEIRGQRDAFLMLIAFLLYNDGVQTIIRMGPIYGAEIGIDQNAQIAALVLVQFIGVPFAYLFGAAATRFGPKPALYVALSIYVVITFLGYNMSETWEFFVLAGLVGTVQGGSQAISRSLFARMIPRHKSSEYFGFFAVFEKFGGIFGPALFSISVSLTGSSRDAFLSVIAFFIVGGLMLRRVNVARGQAQAEAINRSVA